jgi:transcriptional regulator with XRE-family HTH domain
LGAIDDHVGLRLLELRSDRDLSAAQIAAILCTSKVDVELIENGQRRLRAAEMLLLCSKFRVPISFFFDGVDAGLLTSDLLGELLNERSRAKTPSVERP